MPRSRTDVALSMASTPACRSSSFTDSLVRLALDPKQISSVLLRSTLYALKKTYQSSVMAGLRNSAADMDQPDTGWTVCRHRWHIKPPKILGKQITVNSVDYNIALSFTELKTHLNRHRLPALH